MKQRHLKQESDERILRDMRESHTCSRVNRLLSLEIVILLCAPVDLSTADTCMIPSPSISNDTSICGLPRGAGSMPAFSNDNCEAAKK
jgi:hypothetical protein